jgi:DNA polymerase elongation subunit (family B)
MNKPRIVTFDLETIWNIDEIAREDVFFGMSNWPGRTMKASIGSIICFGYKVYGEKRAKCASVWDDKEFFQENLNDDYLVCAHAYEVLKDADAIITHNGKRYDWKYLQTRLKINGLPTLDKIPHIDTCAVAKANFSMYSNRLKDLSARFTPEHKISTGGKNLWTRVYRGDKAAMKEMAEYCKQDVIATESKCL